MAENLWFLLDVGEVKGRGCKKKEKDGKKEKEQEREVA